MGEDYTFEKFWEDLDNGFEMIDCIFGTSGEIVRIKKYNKLHVQNNPFLPIYDYYYTI